MRSAIATWKWASLRQAPLLAAGVGFYAFTSLFPALIAAILCYGLLATPQTVAGQMERLGQKLPSDAVSVITGQLDEIIQTSPNSLGVGLIVALLVALWSASSGIGNLIKAMNVMFGYSDSRGFLRRKALALVLTLGAIVFMMVMLVLVAAAPAILDALVVNTAARVVAEALRWLVLIIGMIAAIAALFRIGPDHGQGGAAGAHVRRGVITAAVIILIGSVGFSLYVDNFGSYGKTYGALAGVIILLLWLWLAALAVLLGAAAARPDTPPQDQEPIGAEQASGPQEPQETQEAQSQEAKTQQAQAQQAQSQKVQTQSQQFGSRETEYAATRESSSDTPRTDV